MSRHHYLSAVLPIADVNHLEKDDIQKAIESFEEEGGETYLDTDGAPRFWMTFDGEAGDTAASGLIQHMHTVAQAAESAAEVEVYVEDQHAAGEAVSNADRFVGPTTEARAHLMVEAHVRALCNDLEEVGSRVPENTRQDLIDHCWEAFAPAADDTPGPTSG